MSPVSLDLLASPRRREILRLVWNHERSAGDIHAAMPDVTFGAVSAAPAHRSRTPAFCSAGEPGAPEASIAPSKEALGAAVGHGSRRMWGDALYRLKIRAEMDAGSPRTQCPDTAEDGTDQEEFDEQTTGARPRTLGS